MDLYKSDNLDPAIVIDLNGITFSDLPYFIRSNNDFIEYLGEVRAEIDKKIKKMQIQYVDDNYNQGLLLKHVYNI